MCKDFFAHQQNTLTNWLYYLPVYDTLLGHNVETNVAILEIGVWKGGSLDMWRKFFSPNAILFGIDTQPWPH